MSGLIVPDFTDVKDAVEAGIYKCRVVGHKLDQWQGKDGKRDTPYVAWTHETYEEAEEKNNGRKIFHNTPIAGPGAFRLKSFFKGVMGEELAGEFDPTMLYGRMCEVTIGQQKTNPEFTEVKTVKPIQ